MNRQEDFKKGQKVLANTDDYFNEPFIVEGHGRNLLGAPIVRVSTNGDRSHAGYDTVFYPHELKHA